MVDYRRFSKARLIEELQRLQAAQPGRDSAAEAQRLHHELEVHQIELEM